MGSIKRKVDLSSLVKHPNGNINWSENIGNKFKFEYMDLKGEFEIIKNDDKNNKVYIKYEDYEGWIFKHNIRNCKFGGILNKRRIQYKYNIGDIIKNETQNFKILDIDIIYGEDSNGYKVPRKRYKLECLDCGYIGWKYECTIESGVKCSCCGCNFVIIKGINDIATTDPWMIKYFINPEDAYKYGCHSYEFKHFKCPHCGRISNKEVKITTLKTKGHLPCICEDGKSYCEKFVFELLSQIKDIKFIYQFSQKDVDWCENYLYDFYIKDFNMIIETHGQQHYKDGFFNTREKQWEKDKLKRELAKDNGVKYYIELNCSKTGVENLKKELLDSELSKILNLSNIDWNKCGEFALNNLSKLICNKYNEIENKYNAISQIIDCFQLSRTTVINYLKKGNELGWCDYTSNVGKRVMVIETGDIYDNVVELSNVCEIKYGVKFSKTQIYNRCLGTTKDTSKDKLHFKYI